MINTFKYEYQAREIKRRVFFTGSTAVFRGQGLCYSRTRGTATEEDGRRDKHVAVPTTTNNLWFAGVSIADYPAQSGGQWVEIYEPGSVIPIAVNIATTVGVTRLTCSAGSADAGRFGEYGLPGRGSALALQSTAAASTSIAVGPIGSSLDGTATVSSDGLTVTKTSAFANAVAGDILDIVAGATTTTMVAGITPGQYVIASKTSSNVVVLATSCSAVAASISFFLFRGNPCVLALLEGAEGTQESGLQEWITPLSTAAIVSMVGGKSNVFGGATITSDSTDTLADGTYYGLLKYYHLRAALTTNDYLLTVTSGLYLKPAGTGFDAWQTLTTLEFDAADDSAVMRWNGRKWQPDNAYVDSTGGPQAA